MGKLVLYGVEASPPVRACKLTLNALGLQYEYRLVNLLAGDQFNKEYTLKNPQHTVPVLDDHGKYIWDSHAIMAYLVRKYAKSDELYPKDFHKRAVVDQRLHFESGVIFQGCIRNIAHPVFRLNETEVPRAKIDAIYEVYAFLEAFLGTTTAAQKYLCGNSLTIADYSVVSSVSSLVGLAAIEQDKYPKLSGWLERMEQLPDYQSNNGNGAQMLIDMFSAKITKIV
ncbi:glutathione S-transferase 1 [Drosophila sulfurigaster albostrigata]|uniref:Glutathione S-transferase 1 n=1 Tax=Drosophila albomicans TaxID=7291 RepID=A0A6P8WTP9_DROAB|nr:glutathione S-transferase 1 [Drosophila albomicans]XP_062129669.1 glutathione S-transferase 1 [Drosophila sulfurigaster albostrigata]